MVKHLHMLFMLLAVLSFVGRVGLQKFKPDLLENKLVKVAPHAIASLLVLTGIVLVFQGGWAQGDMGWVYSKVILLFVFVGLGLYTMKSEGMKKWAAAAAALLVYFYIIGIAFSKQGFI